MRLEQSWAEARCADWLRSEPAVRGIARLRARLLREAYATHRHDTYTIALTECGVQEFDYRGGVHRSLAGQVVLLHPDEAHNGRAGTDAGFVYRALYIEPALLLEALRALEGRAVALPFVADPVHDDPALARLLGAVFDESPTPLRVDELALEVARALHAAAGHGAEQPRRALAEPSLRRAREHLAAHCHRIVRADELERISGLSRFELGAQFKQRFGTSPHRYLVMRRLDAVRERLPAGATRARRPSTPGSPTRRT